MFKLFGFVICSKREWNAVSIDPMEKSNYINRINYLESQLRDSKNKNSGLYAELQRERNNFQYSYYELDKRLKKLEE